MTAILRLPKGLLGQAAYIAEERRWLYRDQASAVWTKDEGRDAQRVRVAKRLLSHARDLKAKGFTIKPEMLSKNRVDEAEAEMCARFAIAAGDTHLGEGVLQTPNGAYNLVTGKLLTWDQQAALVDSRCTGTVPEFGETPIFDSVLEHMCGGDIAVINWLWRYFGYMALGKPAPRLILVLEGPGASGKSTICRVLKRILGSYAIEADRGVLLQSASPGSLTAKYDLRHRRLWYVDELPAAWSRLDLGLAVGDDEIQARRLGMNLTSFKPEGCFVVATNHVPSLHRVDEAVLRRFRIIRCRKTVPASNRRPLLGDEIAREGPAILARIMAEAQAVAADGFQMPETPAAMADALTAVCARGYRS